MKTAGLFNLMKMIYEKYEIVSNDNPHLYRAASEYWTPGLADLLCLSDQAPMKPLTLDAVKGHPLGCSVVGTWYDLPFADHQAVLSYAGVTGCEEKYGQRCAVIGGILVHPSVREIGLGTLMVNWLVRTASTDYFQALLGHENFMARCNHASVKLFKHLGFVGVEIEEGKTIMFKSLIQ